MKVATASNNPHLPIMRDFAAKGFSQADVAREVGISRERVRQLAAIHKITFKKGHARPSLDAGGRLMDLHRQGLSPKKIAQIIGATSGGVRNHLILRGESPNRSERWAQFEASVAACAARGLSISETVREIDVCRNTVINVAARLGIKMTDGRTTRHAKARGAA